MSPMPDQYLCVLINTTRLTASLNVVEVILLPVRKADSFVAEKGVSEEIHSLDWDSARFVSAAVLVEAVEVGEGSVHVL